MDLIPQILNCGVTYLWLLLCKEYAGDLVLPIGGHGTYLCTYRSQLHLHIKHVLQLQKWYKQSNVRGERVTTSNEAAARCKRAGT